MVTVILDN